MDASTNVALQTSLYVLIIPALAGAIAAFLASRDPNAPPRTMFLIIGAATLVSRMGINGSWTAFTNEATYWAWAGALGTLFVFAIPKLRARRAMFAMVVAAAAVVMSWPLASTSSSLVAALGVSALCAATLALPGRPAAAGHFSTLGAQSLLLAAAAALTAAFGSLRYAQLIGAIAVLGGSAALFLVVRARSSVAPALGAMLTAFGILSLAMVHAFVDVALTLVVPLGIVMALVPRVTEFAPPKRRARFVLALTALGLVVAGATGYGLYEPDPYAAYGGY